MRRCLVALVSALCVVVLAACGGSDGSSDDGGGATRLTQAQAELLATVRFRNFDTGVRAVTVTIPASTSGTASAGRLDGWVDFASHLGYASAEQGGGPLGTVVWSGERIAVNESAATPATFPISSSGWRSDALDPQASSLTQALTIVLSLGNDRPENPLLLRQSDAAFLRTDTLDGRQVIVVTGPSPATASSASPAQPSKDRIRYWIDDDGALLRVQAKLSGTTGWTVIDLADSAQTLDPTTLARILAPAA